MEWWTVVAEAASDINENQRKGRGRAQADVLNIGIRTKERVTRIGARATKSFFWQLSEKLTQLTRAQLCARLSPPFQSGAQSQ